MLYRSLDRIATEADVLAAPDLPASPVLSRGERLERPPGRAGTAPLAHERPLAAFSGQHFVSPVLGLGDCPDLSPLGERGT